ncbi:MAG: GT-D fold domain-containing protein [Lachnospiraceae bacterium]|nr:GT-D fold domain-containing protein [Lachnospiraceae bacterium]
MKIYFWGIGNGCRKALANYIGAEELSGFIDNNPKYIGQHFEDKKIVMFKDIKDDFDYIIVTVMNYSAIEYQLKQNEMDMDKIVFYFDSTQDEKKIGALFDVKGWKIDVLEKRLEELERIVNIRFNNAGYEVADKIQQNLYKFPIMHSDEEAVSRIVDEKCSLIRFGDGEFEIIAGNDRVNFQKYDRDLSIRLKEVIQSDQDDILIGIANNYGNLDLYSDEIADGIRGYMTDETRKNHMSLLNPSKVYYNAYMFKCYYPYKDKSKTFERVKLIKKIWDNRDIILIEGAQTRTGQGNDLFDNVKSIRRILCPTQNAYSKYQEILDTAKAVIKDEMVLCVLGPAGKVLSYDLIHSGYQVIDIGQIDMDYEWYRAGAEKKAPNPTKYVSQLPPAEVEDVDDETYHSQIIACITD